MLHEAEATGSADDQLAAGNNSQNDTTFIEGIVAGLQETVSSPLNLILLSVGARFFVKFSPFFV